METWLRFGRLREGVGATLAPFLVFDENIERESARCRRLDPVYRIFAVEFGVYALYTPVLGLLKTGVELWNLS